MLKIDENLRKKDLPSYIAEQLSYIKTFNIRASVFIATFVMLDLMAIIPLLVPMISVYLYVLIPPLLLLHLWCIRLMIKNPFSVQYETILFFAGWGVISAIVFVVLSQKMAFYSLGITDSSYYVITTILFFLAVASILYYRLRRFRDLSYDAMKVEKEKERAGKSKRRLEYYGWIIAICPGLGYMIAQMIKHNEALVHFTLVIIFWGLAIFCSYVATKFIQRSLLLKANPHFCSPSQPIKIEYEKGLVKRGMKIK